MIQSFRTPQSTVRSGHTTNREYTKTNAPRAGLVQVLDHLMDKTTPRDELAIANYLVGYCVQPAEGSYLLEAGELVWQMPTDENIHIVVSVRDAVDGRFLPTLNVQATLIDADGRIVATRQQPFVWHPWLYDYGYGCNWKVPADGKYTLCIRIESSPGDGLATTTVEFKNVNIVIRDKTQ